MPHERMCSDDQAGRIMGQALFSQAREHTYCLISEGEHAGISTAVAVELSGHYFLATAGHVIPRDESAIKVLLRNQATMEISSFEDRRWDPVWDVGLLKIASADADHFQFLKTDVIEAEIVVREESPAFVVGYPAQFARSAGAVDLTTDITCHFIDCAPLGYSTGLLLISQRPTDGLPDEWGLARQLTDDDLLLDYDHEPFVRTFTAHTAGTDSPATECNAIDPHGMSGGGIWLAQVNQSPGGVFSPGMRLIGIQSAWHESSHLLLGVRLGRWLDLVRREYPSLTPVKI